MFRKSRSLFLIAMSLWLTPYSIYLVLNGDGSPWVILLSLAFGIVGVWNFGRLGGFISVGLAWERLTSGSSKKKNIPLRRCNVCAKEIRSNYVICSSCNKTIWG